MAGDPIWREIITAFGWLDVPPELLARVTEASRKELSGAATELGDDRHLIYILDSWADETRPEHEVLARLQKWNRSAGERPMPIGKVSGSPTAEK